MKAKKIVQLMMIGGCLIGAPLKMFAQSQSADEKFKQEEERAKAPMVKPYNPKEDADKKIAELIQKAKVEKKNILIQAGGNWCIWCLRFNKMVLETPELRDLVRDNYLYYHLNFSPENKNEKVFARYGNPGDKYGYPVFIVLDSTGKMIHVQKSSNFEEGSGYSVDKVKTFFEAWKPKG